MTETSLGLYSWCLFHLLGKRSPEDIDRNSLLDDLTWIRKHFSFYRIESITGDLERIFGLRGFNPEPVRAKQYEPPIVETLPTPLVFEGGIYSFLTGSLSEESMVLLLQELSA